MKTLLLILADCQFSVLIGEHPILTIVIAFGIGVGVTLLGVNVNKKNSGIIQKIKNKGKLDNSANITINK